MTPSFPLLPDNVIWLWKKSLAKIPDFSEKSQPGKSVRWYFMAQLSAHCRSTIYTQNIFICLNNTRQATESSVKPLKSDSKYFRTHCISPLLLTLSLATFHRHVLFPCLFSLKRWVTLISSQVLVPYCSPGKTVTQTNLWPYLELITATVFQPTSKKPGILFTTSFWPVLLSFAFAKCSWLMVYFDLKWTVWPLDREVWSLDFDRKILFTFKWTFADSSSQATHILRKSQ